jgi:hypothetical protein
MTTFRSAYLLEATSEAGCRAKLKAKILIDPDAAPKASPWVIRRNELLPQLRRTFSSFP